MFLTKVAETLRLAGFAPAGKLNHVYCSLQRSLQMLVAALGRLNWGKRAWAVLVLCFVSTFPLPGQTLTTLFSFDGTDGSQVQIGLVQTKGTLGATCPS
jgi:hypothetical protein